MKKIIEFIKKYKYVFLYIIFMFIFSLYLFFGSTSSASSVSYSLEYLDIANTSFTTDYIPNEKTCFYLDFETSGLHSWISYLGTDNTEFLFQSNSISSSLSFFYNNIAIDRTLTLDEGRHSLSIDNSTMFIDGVHSAYLSDRTLSCSNFLGLNNNKGHYAETYKIYSFKIYEDDELIRNYEPYCQNGVFGFREAISDIFYSVDNSSGVAFSFPLIIPNISTEPWRVTTITTNPISGFNTELYEIRYCLDDGDWKPMYLNTRKDTWFISVNKNGTYKFRYCYKGTDEQVENTTTSTLTVTNIVEDGSEYSDDIVRPIFSVDFDCLSDGTLKSATVRTQYFTAKEVYYLSAYYKDTRREYSDDIVLWSVNDFKSTNINGVDYYFFEWYFDVDVTLVCSFYDSNLKKFGHSSSITIKLDELYNQYLEEQEENKLPSLLDTLKKTFNFINPFSSEFFGYKLIGLFGDLLKSLFVPSDNYFSDYVEELKSEVSKKCLILIM